MKLNVQTKCAPFVCVCHPYVNCAILEHTMPSVPFMRVPFALVPLSFVPFCGCPNPNTLHRIYQSANKITVLKKTHACLAKSVISITGWLCEENSLGVETMVTRTHCKLLGTLKLFQAHRTHLQQNTAACLWRCRHLVTSY